MPHTAARRATSEVTLLPYKMRQVQAIEGHYYIRIIHFHEWFLWAEHDSVLEPKLTFFTDETGSI
jgi:hypothetical protein